MEVLIAIRLQGNTAVIRFCSFQTTNLSCWIRCLAAYFCFTCESVLRDFYSIDLREDIMVIFALNQRRSFSWITSLVKQHPNIIASDTELQTILLFPATML